MIYWNGFLHMPEHNPTHRRRLKQMPEIHNTDQMQASVKDILAYLSRELPDAIQNMAAPRFVACDFEEKTLELAFEIQPWMRNPANILHGGLTAMMLDTTMGTLSRCYVRGEGITPTITMEVSYLLPIPIGSTLHVRAHASHTGRARQQPHSRSLGRVNSRQTCGDRIRARSIPPGRNVRCSSAPAPCFTAPKPTQAPQKVQSPSARSSST